MSWPSRRSGASVCARSCAARHAVRVEDLRTELGVSTATIRRDLDELEEQWRAPSRPRRRGGHRRPPHRGPFRGQDGPQRAAEAAHRRAGGAAGRARLDASSSTPAAPASSWPGCWPTRTDLTVVTNSLPAIVELAGRGPRLVVVGGELRPLSQALVGPLTRPPARGALRRPCLHGHLQPVARRGPDHDRPERGLHQGAGPGARARGRPARGQQQVRHPLLRPCRPARPDRRRHHRRRPGRGGRHRLRRRPASASWSPEEDPCPRPPPSIGPTAGPSSSPSASSRRPCRASPIAATWRRSCAPDGSWAPPRSTCSTTCSPSASSRR